MKNILEEVKEEIERNKVNKLSEYSHITLKQIEIYMIWQKLREYDIKINDKIHIFNRKISKWTLYRILRQFKENIRKIIIDLIILDILDILTFDTINELKRIGSYYKNGIIDENKLIQLVHSILFKQKG